MWCNCPNQESEEIYNLWSQNTSKIFNSIYKISDEQMAESLLKSDNLQYNTLGRWVDGPNNSSTKRLMFQVSFFFHKILQNSLQKPFQFIFLFFYKITKMKIKSFECQKYIRNYEKKNTWNVRPLVDELFVPSAQRTSVLYCRLSDFMWLSNIYLIFFINFSLI